MEWTLVQPAKMPCAGSCGASKGYTDDMNNLKSLNKRLDAKLRLIVDDLLRQGIMSE
jgi:hypothetical protein